jgi:hypothetical protein
VNCAAVSPGLLDSEVFGHLKGSFTGATQDKKGYLEKCANGVLCLDEIGDAPPYFQEIILRVAEGHPFNKVGSENPTECTARIIAATNKPEKVKPELKYRFHLVPIPPLRKRDIPALCEYFLRDHAEGGYLRSEVMAELCRQRYPGNVRQLLRRCEDLFAKQRRRIFETRKVEVTFHPSDYEAVLPLDYDRYLKEFLIWNEFLAPFIEEFNLKFQYEYQPRTGIDNKNLMPLMQDPQSKIGFSKIMEAVRRGSGEVIYGGQRTSTRDAFARMLEALIAQKQLPYLLEFMDKEGQSREPTQVVHDYDYAPQLIKLLGLPIHDAERQFAEIYLSYVESNHPDSSAAANHSGLLEDAYKKRKQRLKSNRVKQAEK